jgi:hypothetical protein
MQEKGVVVEGLDDGEPERMLDLDVIAVVGSAPRGENLLRFHCKLLLILCFACWDFCLFSLISRYSLHK